LPAGLGRHREVIVFVILPAGLRFARENDACDGFSGLIVAASHCRRTSVRFTGRTARSSRAAATSLVSPAVHRPAKTRPGYVGSVSWRQRSKDCPFYIRNINAMHRSADIGTRIGEEEHRGHGFGERSSEVRIGYCWQHLKLSEQQVDCAERHDRGIYQTDEHSQLEMFCPSQPAP
jgi:hypothetical protein